MGIQYPAVIVPFTKASAELDLAYEDFVPLSELDAHVQSLYDAKLMDGAPVGLQIVGMKWGDAQLLRDSEIIDGILNG
jgi:amidase